MRWSHLPYLVAELKREKIILKGFLNEFPSKDQEGRKEREQGLLKKSFLFADFAEGRPLLSSSS